MTNSTSNRVRSIVISIRTPTNLDCCLARVLCTFLLSKLEDSENTVPALKGLNTLSTLQVFTSGEVRDTVVAYAQSNHVDRLESPNDPNRLFKHVNMRAHVQSTRHLVWTLLDSLVARHRESGYTPDRRPHSSLPRDHWVALGEMGADFLKGYTELAEGEKDPRNLLLAFSIGRVLLLEFDVKPYIEVRFPSQEI